MKRVLCCMMCLALILALAAPASAAEDSGNWLQVLGYSTVNDSGSNYFVVNKSATISLKLPTRTYGVWVDMLVNTSDMDITSVESIWSGSYTKLTVSKISNGLFRVFGRLSYHTYTELQFRFKCSGTGYYELLSCKLSSIAESVLYADAFMDFTYMIWNGSTLEDYSVRMEQSSNFVVDSFGEGAAAPWQACVQILDWQNFDSLTVWGSVDDASLGSVRATVGNISLPVTMNYIDITTGEYAEAPDLKYPDYYGKYLYSIKIDTSEVNPALSSQYQQLLVYMTGKHWDKTGMIMGFQYVVGELAVADTTDATWRTWAGNMLTSIQNLPERIAEELGKLYKPDEGKLDAVQQQSQELAEDRLGAVYQAGQVVDGLIGAFQHQTATEFLTVPVLTVPLGEVNWTIGGWTVQVVPDAFKPIVETLKIVIDIVCTLAFVKSMRNRLERLLSGGNA